MSNQMVFVGNECCGTVTAASARTVPVAARWRDSFSNHRFPKAIAGLGITRGRIRVAARPKSKGQSLLRSADEFIADQFSPPSREMVWNRIERFWKVRNISAVRESGSRRNSRAWSLNRRGCWTKRTAVRQVGLISSNLWGIIRRPSGTRTAIKVDECTPPGGKARREERNGKRMSETQECTGKNRTCMHALLRAHRGCVSHLIR